MTSADVIYFAGYGLMAWLTGYGVGYLHGFIKRIFRHAADLS